MASPGYGQPQSDQVRSMENEVKTLIVQRMKDVLREEGLPVSGIKSELQIRLIAHIEKLSAANDTAGLNRLRSLIRGISRPQSHQSPYSTYTPPMSASPGYSSPGPRYPQPYGNNAMASPSLYSSKNVSFKNSAFYTIVRPLTSVTECKAREHTRDTARLMVTLTSEVAEQLQRDSNMRVMVFCAAETPFAPSQGSEIAFPHQVELKCNSDEVKANLRGLKNKVGSTRPADITSLIRKKANYPNSVEMVYALTQKKFYVVVNLIEKRPVEDLVAEIKAKYPLRKEQVIKEMLRRRDDPDIEATSTVLSLKCPLSYTRIVVPCRSMSCSHNQCFDAASYLQLQEQAPTWTCPICSKSAPYTSLQVDLYVDDILKKTSSIVEQVTIEPDGEWHKQGATENSRKSGGPTPDDDDEEGFVVIGDDRVASLKQESRLKTAVQTPPTSSREQSTASSAARSNKRPASEVIDLTLSDDDDDAPPAKIKRPSMSTSESFQSRAFEPWTFDLPRPNPINFSNSPFSLN